MGIVSFALQMYVYILLLYVIFSWVPNPPEGLRPFVVGVARLVEPVAMPLRRIIPPLRIGAIALDLSIIVLFIGIQLLLSVTRSLGL